MLKILQSRADLMDQLEVNVAEDDISNNNKLSDGFEMALSGDHPTKLQNLVSLVEVHPYSRLASTLKSWSSNIDPS